MNPRSDTQNPPARVARSVREGVARQSFESFQSDPCSLGISERRFNAGQRISVHTLKEQSTLTKYWDQFTEKARAAIWVADAEAKQREQECISTELLLLGLMQDKENMACLLMQQVVMSPRNIYETLLQQAFHEAKQDGPGSQLSVNAERVLERAYDETRQCRCSHIGTEHLLIGLLREKEGVAGRALTCLGLDVENLRGLAAGLYARK